MGIKKTHTHENGSVCYEMRPPRTPHQRYDSKLLDPELVEVAGEIFAVARWSYTGNWIVYDVTTGKKIDSVGAKFYERLIKPFSIGPLLDKPDCVQSEEAAANVA